MNAWWRRRSRRAAGLDRGARQRLHGTAAGIAGLGCVPSGKAGRSQNLPDSPARQSAHARHGPGRPAARCQRVAARGKQMDAYLRWLHHDLDRVLATLTPPGSTLARAAAPGPQATAHRQAWLIQTA